MLHKILTTQTHIVLGVHISSIGKQQFHRRCVTLLRS